MTDPQVGVGRVVDATGTSVLSSNDPDKIPLYCINLEDSIERRNRVTRRFAALGLLDRVRFVTAVGPDSEVVTEHVKNFGLPEPSARRRRELAAALSHLRVIETFLGEPSENTGSAIVFEDDVLLHEEWNVRLERTLANLPVTVPVCALGYLPNSGFKSNWVGVDPLKRNLIAMTPGKAWGAMAYWISRDFAEEIRNEFDEIAKGPNLLAEHLMWRVGGCIAQPPLVIEDGLDSTIRSESELAKHNFWHRAWGVQNYVVLEEDRRLLDLDPDRPPQSICLCMIVRNEAGVIERLAESVKQVIDTWVICDTGSIDGTPDQVRNAFEGIPGELYFDEWQDFGTNRTLMIERARNRADYLLLLDADETLHVQGDLPFLNADAYSLLVDEPTHKSTPRLVKGSRPWRFVGATHEYLTCEKKITERVCPMLVLETHPDNSEGSSQLLRDRELLEKAYARDSTDPHTVQYLAQVYRDLGEDQLAIEFYTRLRMLGGSAEETFYAMHARAELVSKTDWDLGTLLFLKAWEYRPSRVEPLYALLHGLRVRSQFHLGAVIGEWARKVRVPKDTHFVRADLYEWRVEFEYSICALRIGDHKSALSSSERLLKKRLPDEVLEQVIRNRAACLAAVENSEPSGEASRPNDRGGESV
jgi:GR25 family glycosyltransferase involved in LPS biosynthesis